MNPLTVSFEVHFDLFTFIAFFVGFFSGLIFLVLIYLYVALRSLRKKKKVIDNFEETIKEDEIKTLIHQAQKDFLAQKKKAPIGESLKMILQDLIVNIAKQFYPDSKHPIAELTMDELIHLDRYIADMIDNLLSRRGLRMLRNVKLSTIMNLMDANSKIKNSKPMKITQKYHLDKAIKVGSLVLNTLNPFYWFKRLVVSPSLNLIIKKMFLLMISITGEETYRIYSKKIFNEEDEELYLLLQAIKEEEALEKANLETDNPKEKTPVK